MCLGVPGRIIEIKGDTAMVDVAGAKKKASIALLTDASPGDYVIIHAGFAIEKIDVKKAEETLEIIRSVTGKDV